ncbi:MAG: TetR/AcrR family transcriptional regulator [Thermoleophilaceae bacterium]|nr:TetR/AcrR family transcriptional regulator [Thermoleophilaceae bacterium]
MNDPSSPLDSVSARPGGRSARIRDAVHDAVREELAKNGYGALSHRTVAQRAGVDPATVYRRWPTRSRLTIDSLLAAARYAVPVPDTGAAAQDFELFLDSLTSALSEPRMLRLFHALSAAGGEAEGDLRDLLREFWSTRFEGAEDMVTRAVVRGELPGGADPRLVIEQLIAPTYFRALVTGDEIGGEFTRRCVRQAIAGAGA